MTRRKRKDTLSSLESDECAEVLRQLLNRYPDLRDEANSIASDLLDDASVEVVSDEVTDLVLGIGLEDLGRRAGKQPWGYVEPGEAAWELLEEAIKCVHNDMRRRIQAGMEPAAEKLCQGIVIGLHNATKTKSDGALGWAPDFPAEAAAQAVSNLIELYPRSRRRAAANRIIAGVEQQAQEWVEMLHRAVRPVMPLKRQTRRRK
jgi:hypothetical protein